MKWDRTSKKIDKPGKYSLIDVSAVKSRSWEEVTHAHTFLVQNTTPSADL